VDQKNDRFLPCRREISSIPSSSSLACHTETPHRQRSSICAECISLFFKAVPGSWSRIIRPFVAKVGAIEWTIGTVAEIEGNGR